MKLRMHSAEGGRVTDPDKPGHTLGFSFPPVSSWRPTPFGERTRPEFRTYFSPEQMTLQIENVLDWRMGRDESLCLP